MRFKLIIDTLEPVLQAYVESDARVSIIRGPLGSGKTVASCQKLFGIACKQRPNRQGIRKTRFVAIRNTFPDLLTTTVKDWLELFGDLGNYKAGGISPPSHTIRFRLPDRSIVESEIIFIALDRPLSIKKLRGMQVTVFWLNELKELDKAVVDMADFRHGRYPSKMDGGCTFHGMIGDTNSPDDDHWLFAAETEVKLPDWAFFTQPGGLMREYAIDEATEQKTWTGDWIPNPAAENLHNLPDGYYTIGQQNKSEDWIAVNLANEYGTVHDGQPIYKRQWSDIIHVSSTVSVIKDWPIVVGMDFGLSPAAVIGQETPNGAVHILEELVGSGMGIEQFATSVLLPVLHNKYRDHEVYFTGDPAGNKRSETDESTVFGVLSELGIDAEEAYSNDPLIRWEAVRYYLQQLRDGEPAFKLHSRCKMLRKGFNGGYKLRRIQLAGSSKFADRADKNEFSHPHDGLQYLCMFIKSGVPYGHVSFVRPEETDRWSK